MGFKCDLCGNLPGLLNYRRRGGKVICTTCLDDNDCQWQDAHQEYNPDGPRLPPEVRD